MSTRKRVIKLHLVNKKPTNKKHFALKNTLRSGERTLFFETLIYLKFASYTALKISRFAPESVILVKFHAKNTFPSTKVSLS